MPFDFAAPADLSSFPPDARPMDARHMDAGTILGVPRHELVAHALGQIAPSLRNAVAEIEVSGGGQFVHMGMVFDQVAWRAAWRRPGLPVASGSFPVWNGSPV